MKIIENDIDGSRLILVPGGRFLAGDPLDEEEGGAFEVELPPFYLGETTVTNEQYARFLNETQPLFSEVEAWVRFDRESFLQEVDGRYEPRPGKEHHPVGQVNWYGAQAYCVWAGVRLPTELEWEKGARGVDGRIYPWGSDWDANCWRRFGETTCEVFRNPDGRSCWGHYQMGTNVNEWCEDVYEEEAYERYRRGDLSLPSNDPKPNIPPGRLNLVLWWLFRAINLSFALILAPKTVFKREYTPPRVVRFCDEEFGVLIRDEAEPNIRHHYIGFRVAKSAT